MSAPTSILDPAVSGMQMMDRWIIQGEVGGFNDRLRTRPLRAEPGHVEFECTLGAGHANLAGILHGGVTAALVDVAAGAAVMTLLQPGETLLTADLQMRFLKPAEIEGSIFAKATVIHRAGRRNVVNVSVEKLGEVLALASASIAIRPPRSAG